MTEMQMRERRATEYRVKVYRRQLRRRARRRRSACRALTALLLCLWIAVLVKLTMPNTTAADTGYRKPSEPSYELSGVDIPATTYASLDGLECLGTYKVTAYCSCPKCCGIWSDRHPSRIGTGYVQKTASGTIPRPSHTIAADTSVLPFGTEVIMDGQIYTVEDTGNGVRGKHIDLYMNDHEAALAWGVQRIELYREAT